MAEIREQSRVSHDVNRAQLSAQIKTRALASGFDKVGIVRVDALLPEQAHLKKWLDRGYYGEMSWMTRAPEQRTDPREVFPEAKSVIAVALNYYTPHQHEVSTTRVSVWDQDASLNGKISRYAWGDDYHEIIGEKLRALLEWITAQWPEAKGKVCVDIQPLMDKAWAARAGLGWIGKHTNLITRDYGSWVFLGELLLNLELAFDREEIADQCGS